MDRLITIHSIAEAISQFTDQYKMSFQTSIKGKWETDIHSTHPQICIHLPHNLIKEIKHYIKDRVPFGMPKIQYVPLKKGELNE